MRKIGVICAMEMEAAHVAAALSDKRQEKRGSYTFTTGSLGNKEVVLGLSGIGKVAAALCTQAMILSFQPEAVINSGVAGSLTDQLGILDTALSTALVQHDLDTTPIGDPPGWLSSLNRGEIPGDPALLAAAEEAARETGVKTLCGMIASGDQFIESKEQKEKILAHFPAIACEMEGAAAAYAAYLAGVPFLAVRAISDSPGHDKVEYPVFAPRAAAQGARLLIAAIKRL